MGQCCGAPQDSRGAADLKKLNIDSKLKVNWNGEETGFEIVSFKINLHRIYSLIAFHIKINLSVNDVYIICQYL